MEENKNSLINTCNLTSVRPIMMDLPYPPVQVREQNPMYANLLSIDYCGSVSELSAIAQYINSENRLSSQNCELAKTILGIAIAEMIHLEKLGELILLLGGEVDFVARQNDGRKKMWTPQYLSLSSNVERIIAVSVESEKAAIRQYRMHMNMIKDDGVKAILARIIKDEEYHIMILQSIA